MESRHKKIGISGGTFNPIHYGHLIISEAVRDIFKLDRVLFIPSGTPPHKTGSNVAEAGHRYGMVQRAVSSNPAFEPSRIEMDREGNTYTIDTLRQLKGIYGDQAELFFIVGADTVLELTTWKDYEKVFSMCEFISANRPGYGEADYLERVNQLKVKYGARISTIDAPLIEISSTDIRQRIKDGRSIKYLVPDSVEQYIYEHGLYL